MPAVQAASWIPFRKAKTGMFINQPTVEQLVEALKAFNPADWDADYIREAR